MIAFILLYANNNMDATGAARISLSNEEIIILTEDFAKDYMKSMMIRIVLTTLCELKIWLRLLQYQRI